MTPEQPTPPPSARPPTDPRQRAAGTRRQFGKYRLIAHLATGGMAEIFLAAQTGLGGFEKTLVIKRILPNLAREEKFIQMFLDEARIAATLNHPNVVQIYDVGRVESQYFMAMEYLAGENLAMLVKACAKRGVAMPPEMAAGIIMQAAEGLHHAHTTLGADGRPLGIVHRDISPQNIFVLYSGGVKVVDFGIAKAALRTTQTRTGTLKGKYAYMSPEQILGRELDARSDVFALGVVLWECLAGRKLFREENDLALLRAITEQDAPPPSSVQPSLPAEIVRITIHALRRERDLRHPSAAAMRADLAAYLRTAQRTADTVAIGKVMHSLFKDRVETKRQLVENALVSDREAGDKVLVEEFQSQMSDTEHSIPDVTPGTGLADIETISRQAREPGPASRTGPRPWVLGAVGLALLAVIGLSLAYVLDALPGRNALAVDTLEAAPSTEVGGADAGLAVEPDGDSALVPAPVPADATVPASADPEPFQVAPPAPPRSRSVGKRKRVTAVKPLDPAPKPEPEPPPVALPPGKLRLTTNPWAEIFHQGNRLGQTPLVDVVLPAGVVKLTAVNKEAGIEKTLVITIKSGERVIQRFNLH